MQLHRRAFTLIELLVVITLIAVLSTALLVGANALKRKAAQAQTAAFIGDLTTALIHLSTNDGSLPQPDNGSFIRYDPDLDLADTTELKDYATWPVMNKVLLSGTMASFDRARFQGRVVFKDVETPPRRTEVAAMLAEIEARLGTR